MLSDELELVNSLTSTLASFKEDPGVSAGGGGGKFRSAGSKSEREDHHTRDPDVWPPPTPIEPRCLCMRERE